MSYPFLDAGPVWWGYMSKCTAFLMLNHRLPSASSDEQCEVQLAAWLERQRVSLTDQAAYERLFGPHKYAALSELMSDAETLKLAIHTIGQQPSQAILH